MKTRKTLLCSFLLLCSSAYAQEINLQPQPQQVVAGNKSIQMPSNYNLIGETDACKQAVKELKNLLGDNQQNKSSYSIYIGEKGDKAIRKFAKQIPAQPEGYYLQINDKQLVLAGQDERGTYYALQTLKQLLKNDQLPEIEIKDFPAIRFRGVVEGFYGTPWSHEARIRQLQFYGANKMNTYIYGPKDDPYHSSPNWRLPYPEKEAAQLQELINIAHDNEVDFVWAIHPGQDIKWNQEDKDNLLQKFEKMYQLGVRSFAVFFDDISGDGTNPVKQAELLNYIDDTFVKVKADVTPLIMCPTEYNKSWSNPEKGYLATLGTQLNPSIQIMWTGDRVISEITRSGVEWINGYIKRPAYIWWNFPVSDYVRDHLLLGPVYGNDTDIAALMSGFVSNPMEYAEASKIAIYSVADYAWNTAKYNSEQSWKNAIANIMPSNVEAMTFFAANNSDLGANGHQFRREESVEIQPLIKHFSETYTKGNFQKEDMKALQDVFSKAIEYSDLLITDKENEPLIKEISPWLQQFKLLGETGTEVLNMVQAYESKDQELFLRKYKHVKALQQQSFLADQTSNQNPYQPGVKVGSKILKPFIDETFATVTTRYNQTYNTQLNAASDYSPHKLVSDVEQLKHLPLQIKANKISISPALEVIQWPADHSLTIELDNAYTGVDVTLDFKTKDIETWGKLESSVDGTTWKNLDMTTKETRVTADLANSQIKFIRFTNAGKEKKEAYLRNFTITIKK